jgi:RNA dependent RNA polymerase
MSSSNHGSSSKSCQTFHSKKFTALALFDIYRPRGLNKKEFVDSIPHKHIDELEADVCQQAPNKKVARLFDSFGGTHIKLYCDVKFESCDPPVLEFKAEIVDNSCLFFRAFGALRFISATFWVYRNVSFHEIISPNMKELFDRGLSFADLKYKFVGGKISDTNSEKMPNYYKFDTWFFAERGFPNGDDVSIQNLRNWLGDFGNQPLLKVNCRLSLGFSPSEPRFLLRDEDVFVIDDITNYCGKVMTDGCGYISVSTVLLRNIVNLVWRFRIKTWPEERIEGLKRPI